MGGEGDGERGLEEWLEHAADALMTLIGKRVAGVAVSDESIDLVFDDCTVLSIKGGVDALIEIASLEDLECRCLRKCLEAHGVAREETQECMDHCLEEPYQQ